MKEFSIQCLVVFEVSLAMLSASLYFVYALMIEQKYTTLVGYNVVRLH